MAQIPLTMDPSLNVLSKASQGFEFQVIVQNLFPRHFLMIIPFLLFSLLLVHFWNLKMVMNVTYLP